jgi:hypothetical protein
MRHSALLFAVLSSVAGLSAGCAGVGEGAGVGERAGVGEGDIASSRAALTTQDIDVAPECEGILTYANVASFGALDAFLPSNIAQNIVSARSVSPFTTLKALSDVSGVGPFHLELIEHNARSDDFIDAECAGIYEEIALSHDDAAAMVNYVNNVSEAELEGVLYFLINPMTKDNLLANRPFVNVAVIADTAGVGVDSFRALRNAATTHGPFEALAAAATALNRDVTILRHFDWEEAISSDQYYLSGMTCFGIDPALLVNGATIRPQLADAAEVLADVSGAVSYANRYNELTVDPAVGLADLANRIQGGTFFGCYLDYTPDPWSGVNRDFFVDTVTGFGVLTETSWSE